MRTKRLKSVGLIILLLGVIGLQAQEAITTSGGNASGGGGFASYSVGLILYTTYVGANVSVAQGVQQQYEISVVTEIEEAKGINLSISVYPNPTTDIINLEVGASSKLSIESLSYQLFDINGKLLLTNKFEPEQTKIDLSNFILATYSESCSRPKRIKNI